jgi:phosphoglycolate phosphatase-like HAD superfamily hydrolase
VPTTDLPRLFGRLRAGGRLIAVATTDDRTPTDATLRALGIRELASALVCGDDGLGVKPDPRMVLAICEALQVEPGRTAVVGDTVADMAMGRAAEAGLLIAVLSGVDTAARLAPLADLVLPSIADLPLD